MKGAIAFCASLGLAVALGAAASPVVAGAARPAVASAPVLFVSAKKSGSAAERAKLEKICGAPDPDAAIDACTKLLAQAGNPPPKTRTTAIIYLARGAAHTRKHEVTLAVTDLDAAIAISPKLAPAYTARGFAFIEDGDNDGALKDFDQAISLDARIAESFVGRSLAYEAKDDLKHALADADKAVRMNPSLVMAYLARGDIYRRQGDLDEAIADVKKAVRLMPKGATPKDTEAVNKGLAGLYALRAGTMFAIGAFSRAINDFGEAIQLVPDDAGAHVARGFAYMGSKDVDHALADFEAAIKLDEKLASAYVGRGLVKIQQGDEAGGQADLKKASEIDPSTPLMLPSDTGALTKNPV